MNEDHKERRGAARKKVLIAEDVGLFFELEESILWRNDIDILVAQTGQQALEMIKQERPDLVLIDLNMPEMSGDECCRIVKKRSGAALRPRRDSQPRQLGGRSRSGPSGRL